MITSAVITMTAIKGAAAAMGMRLNRPVDDLAGMLESEIARLIVAGSDFAGELERAKEIVTGRISAGLV